MIDDVPAWRTLIVDDEPLARDGIRARLTMLGGFDIVAECGSGHAAVSAIRTQVPDVVFLDIQMPVLDGFGVIDQVGVDAMPTTVFVTAHDHHAVRAFDAQALDYVRKPIDDARFARAVQSVRRRLSESRATNTAERLMRLLVDVRASAPPHSLSSPRCDRLVARDGARVEMIPFDEIDWVSADGDYVRVHTTKRHLLLRLTMARIEQALPPGRHVRIHRSTIVNVTRVRAIDPLPNADAIVTLHNGVSLRASRSYTDRLRSALGIT